MDPRSSRPVDVELLDHTGTRSAQLEEHALQAEDHAEPTIEPRGPPGIDTATSAPAGSTRVPSTNARRRRRSPRIAPPASPGRTRSARRDRGHERSDSPARIRARPDAEGRAVWRSHPAKRGPPGEHAHESSRPVPHEPFLRATPERRAHRPPARAHPWQSISSPCDSAGPPRGTSR